MLLITQTGGQFIYNIQAHENKCGIEGMSYTYDIGSIDSPDVLAAGSHKNNQNLAVVSFLFREQKWEN